MKKIGVLRDGWSKYCGVYEHEGRYFIASPGESPSLQWEWIGLFRFNNFGHIVERIPVHRVLTEKLQWTYKNGKQRLFIVDIDHGTLRHWGARSQEFIRA